MNDPNILPKHPLSCAGCLTQQYPTAIRTIYWFCGAYSALFLHKEKDQIKTPNKVPLCQDTKGDESCTVKEIQRFPKSVCYCHYLFSCLGYHAQIFYKKYNSSEKSGTIWQERKENHSRVPWESRYLQSWKYFENVKMDLKQRHYKIKNELLEEASPYVEDIKRKVSKEAVFVGVHVRRGDIVHERKPVGHIPAPIPYFYRAMNYFRKRYSNVVFVMISNSMMWCQDHLDDSSNVYHVETGDPYIDFAILHKMDHLILSVGTFGWWAGYLSPGTVIFYKGYPKANTTMSIEMKQTDFIPRHWVGL
ncbi:FUT1_2 [Mytilus edulis]|uniref:L-Fucosyltransferase n=1 Tax=Mytilus edulis TaxID=6550 RepID=A0A8S3TX44_MYTED|nr:FUT1_2 [Mytilus edulis]